MQLGPWQATSGCKALLCCCFMAVALALAGASGSTTAATAPAEGHWRKPGFCGRMDCPEYSVWQKNYDFEVREYKEAVWVAANVSAVKYELAIKAATPLLFAYFWGANKERLRMKETVPLTTHYRLDLHPHTGDRRNYTIAMFVPYLYQKEPPQPTHPAVWLYCSPRADMFVRMFQHRQHEWRVVEEARALVEALEHAGHDFELGAIIAASYDHPMKHHPHRHRYHHSEVWMRGTFNRSATPQATQPAS